MGILTRWFKCFKRARDLQVQLDQQIETNELLSEEIFRISEHNDKLLETVITQQEKIVKAYKLVDQVRRDSMQVVDAIWNTRYEPPKEVLIARKDANLINPDGTLDTTQLFRGWSSQVFPEEYHIVDRVAGRMMVDNMGYLLPKYWAIQRWDHVREISTTDPKNN